MIEVLYIGSGVARHYWGSEILPKALEGIARVTVAPTPWAAGQVDLVVLDGLEMEKLDGLIAQGYKVAVATASPTWRRSREVVSKGAWYFRKLTDLTDLRLEFEDEVFPRLKVTEGTPNPLFQES